MLWFDRTFEFAFPTSVYPCVVERLAGLIPRLEAKVAAFPEEDWTARPDGRWSAQENLGHLGDLEDLWRGRIEDFVGGVETLRPADLQNAKTDQADHNRSPLADLLRAVTAARATTLHRIAALTAADFGRTSLHPRLQTPMRLVDSLFFAAEHDDHHLARITAILAGTSAGNSLPEGLA